MRRQSAQFAIDQRQQFFCRLSIALLDTLKDLGHITHGKKRPLGHIDKVLALSGFILCISDPASDDYPGGMIVELLKGGIP